MKLLHVVGARPNFPKLSPVFRAGVARGLDQVILHTGQHYDDLMSASFFAELGIPRPHVNLSVGSGSHALQTARLIERLEVPLNEERPDWVVVYGDVNSTLAASLVAAKLGLRIAHVEAGLRSGDRSMPEEINRLVTDRLADLLLTPSRDADARLLSEGEDASKIVFVGNVMIDTLNSTVRAAGLVRAKTLRENAPVVVTLHRPSNVDVPERFAQILAALSEVARERPVLFAAHPRTAARLREFKLATASIRITGPMPYLELLTHVMQAAVVITDSGGLQEETTALGIPCLTLRNNTERPVTVSEGTNSLVRDMTLIPSLVAQKATAKNVLQVPEGWDGQAGPRVIEALLARSRVMSTQYPVTAET